MHLYNAQGYFYATTAELSSRNREHPGGKAENIYLALYRKSLSIPVSIQMPLRKELRLEPGALTDRSLDISPLGWLLGFT